MNIENKTLYKLEILFLLKSAQFRLSNVQIISFFQENNISDYFQIQEVIAELVDTNLIEEAKSKIKSLYTITEAGLECIKYFEKDIGSENINLINLWFQNNSVKLKNESNVLATFVEGNNYSYDSLLDIMEGKDSLLSIKLNVPDSDTARLVCENWKSKSQNIYEYIIKQLLGEGNID